MTEIKASLRVDGRGRCAGRFGGSSGRNSTISFSTPAPLLHLPPSLFLGKNKIVQVAATASLGAKFMVHPSGFLVHRQHTESASRKAFLRVG